MYSPTLPSTLALDGGGWSTPRPGRFTSGKTWYPLYMRLGGPQGWSGQMRKISAPPGFHPRTVRPIVSRYTDYAIPAPWALCTHLNEHLLNCWFGQAGQVDFPWWNELQVLWIEHHVISFYGGHSIRGCSDVPPLLKYIIELKQCILEAIAFVTADILEWVWQEIDYRIDVCCVTKGAHMESL